MSVRSRYEAFVAKNEDLVRKLQEVANILVFLLPGNTVDGETMQEGGLAAINLFVIYHNLLFKAKKKLKLANQTGRKGGLSAARSSVRASRAVALTNATSNEEINQWEEETVPKEETPTRSALRLALTICAHTEVVAEMVAIRLVGDENKWPVITLIEALKSMSRSWLLSNANGPRMGEGGDTKTLQELPRIQHHGCQYPSSDEPLAGPFTAPPGVVPSSSSSSEEKVGPDDPIEVMRRTMNYRHRYRNRWSTQQSQMLRFGTMPTAHHIVRLGETLHIMRPVVYAMCRWRMGSKKWTPLLISAMMDFLSASCVDVAASVHAHAQGKIKDDNSKNSKNSKTSSNNSNNSNNSNPTITAAIAQAILGRQMWGLMGPLFGTKAMPSGFLERHDAAMMQLYSFEDRAEFSRRRSMWLYYLLRDPLFDSLTRPSFAKVAGVLSYIPLVGGLAEYAMFSLEYYQKKHFWFAASSSGR